MIQNSSKNEKVTTNPFYLHPNESPSLMLTSSVATGNNFYFWSHSMRLTLISKNKLKFVDDSIPILNKDDLIYVMRKV